MRKILFFFFNTHQRRVFTFIKQHLSPGDTGNLLAIKGIAVRNWLIAFKIVIFPKHYPLDGEVIERIIRFSSRRMMIRYPQMRLLEGIIKLIQQNRARVYFYLFSELYSSFRPDLVILWSGLILPLAAAASAARQLRIKLLFCENGYLPRTIVMDKQGVNARNELTGKPRDFYDQVIVDEARLSQLIAEQLQPRPLKGNQFRKQSELVKLEQQLKLPEKFIFLPLQVFDDSQILLYSHRFRDMKQLISYCAQEIKRYNDKYGREIALVVKEHPSDFGRINYDMLKRKFTNIIFVRTISSQELINKCLVVVTINSTVGIEGLFCFKPVITLGEAFYNVPGLVYHLADGEELAEKLDEALTGGVDRELIEKFLYYLRYRYLVTLDRRQLHQADPTEVLARINSVLNT